MAETWKKLAFEDDVITKAFMAAKGDLIGASADNTPLILTVGANDKVLTAASGEASGLKWEDAGGSGMAWEVISANDTAVTNEGYLINASAGAITLTLPASPSEGDQVGVVDAYDKATTNVITIARNSENIEGVAEDLVIDIDGAGMILVYCDATRGWEIVSEIGANTDDYVTADAVLTDDYLVSGDGGARKVQSSVASISDAGLLTVPTINLTGGRIAFPATQDASAGVNTLDDYEEGYWTPDLRFAGLKVGITYTSTAGKYVKIGKFVYISLDFTLSSKGSSTGIAQIFGMPFNNVGYTGIATLGFYSGGNLYQNVGDSNFIGSTQISLYSTAQASLTDTIFTNTTRLILNGFYESV